MNQSFFRDPGRSGIFHLPTLSRQAVEAAAAGLDIREADLRQSQDKQGVLNELGHAFRFPDWYGANLDALYDCLTDPDWYPPGGQVLLISGLARLQGADPDSFSALLEVFSAASEARREAGAPLWVLIDAASPDLPALS
ncbi:MAG TPA: barstar family protein [Rhodocyclaceae bacterium]|nr:barstar family protein [Rhodocyclaceae bacterium]